MPFVLVAVLSGWWLDLCRPCSPKEISKGCMFKDAYLPLHLSEWRILTFAKNIHLLKVGFSVAEEMNKYNTFTLTFKCGFSISSRLTGCLAKRERFIFHSLRSSLFYFIFKTLQKEPLFTLLKKKIKKYNDMNLTVISHTVLTSKRKGQTSLMLAWWMRRLQQQISMGPKRLGQSERQ